MLRDRGRFPRSGCGGSNDDADITDRIIVGLSANRVGKDGGRPFDRPIPEPAYIPMPTLNPASMPQGPSSRGGWRFGHSVCTPSAPHADRSLSGRPCGRDRLRRACRVATARRMTGRFEHFDARFGGSYRLVLAYADASAAREVLRRLRRGPWAVTPSTSDHASTSGPTMCRRDQRCRSRGGIVVLAGQSRRFC
jgi:hypothetical protein